MVKQLLSLILCLIVVVYSHSSGPQDCYISMPEDMCYNNDEPTVNVTHTITGTFDRCGTYTFEITTPGVTGVSVYPTAGSVNPISSGLKFQEGSEFGECVTHSNKNVKAEIMFEWTAPNSDLEVDFYVIALQDGTVASACVFGEVVVSLSPSGASQCSTSSSSSSSTIPSSSEAVEESSESDSASSSNENSEEENASFVAQLVSMILLVIALSQ